MEKERKNDRFKRKCEDNFERNEESDSSEWDMKREKEEGQREEG